MLTGQRWFDRFSVKLWHLLPIGLAIAVGLILGILFTVANNISNKWLMVVIGAVAAFPLFLAVKDYRKLFLVIFVVDIPFGIDIAIQNQGWHRGGPTGYIVSLSTVILVLAYALWIIERKPTLQFFPEITVPALLYLFVILLSFFQARNVQLSAFGLFLKAQAFLMAFYVANHVRTRHEIQLVAMTAGVCLLLESILMILQYFTGASLNFGGLLTSGSLAEGVGGAGVTGSRVAGTLLRPGNAALYLNSMLPFAISAYLTGSLMNNMVALPSFALGLVALVVTSSRGGWLSFATAALVMVVVVGRHLWNEAATKGLLIFLVATLLLGIFWGQVGQRLVTVTEDRSREQLDTMAFNLIKVYPLGLGENNYELYMADKYAHPAMVGHTHLTVHNRYLLIWSETGPQGLILFILLLLIPFWRARHWIFNTRLGSELVVLQAGLLAALASHIVHMRSENFNGRSQIYLLWFILTMLAVVHRFIMREVINKNPTADVV